YENCFSVAATDSNDGRASFSNYGTWVYAAAPGASIYTTTPDGGYRYVNGTSFSTPYVAGVAGLLASQGLTNLQIRDRLCGTADKINGTGISWTCGRVNASRAVRESSTSQTPRRMVFLPLVAR
nr:S8 family serine peptidase [Chloroflexaceae bacterium]